ncbi:hypothetical protein [Chromobacterium piscinae]|uniref:DUF721 domain-containing protein n=1 Tax=Chromobacterium piscinae TaxID=686831 RepID=A0ABV0HBH2_9NEIS|nr:hypothetical protein [Chromobacterium piscinae]MBX9297388.1 hypothetical protein [Chromobacterium vaccinii]MBX9348918.1 hypothetical protein [Chromobacterium vaccinii]MBX9358771.1 hypothetical protein [Chromobacterium vaccinii]MCD4505460.1 hypothetical protein [Chromobacterium piscinae]MCD5329274.1 hypothetical protein [Chromobacterium piscinae]
MMQNPFLNPRQQQRYQLSIACPAMSLGAARRELRGQALKHGLRILQWREQPQAPARGAILAAAPWLISADFRSDSTSCMHFLQGIAQRLTTLPLTQVKLECLSLPPTANRALA